MGLREEKKQKTRKTISDLATRLFAERGYDAVTTAEIAQLAGVSVPTLFHYFPTKEALVFDEDSEAEARLVATVQNRPPGQSVSAALLEVGLDALGSVRTVQLEAFTKVVEETPVLSRYAREMWLRHERALGAAIREATTPRPSKLEADAIARFVLDSYHRSFFAPKPKAALRALFALLEQGWRG